MYINLKKVLFCLKFPNYFVCPVCLPIIIIMSVVLNELFDLNWFLLKLKKSFLIRLSQQLNITTIYHFRIIWELGLSKTNNLYLQF